MLTTVLRCVIGSYVYTLKKYRLKGICRNGMLLSLSTIPTIYIIVIFTYVLTLPEVEADTMEKLAVVAESNTKFGIKILKLLASIEKDKNVFLSPFSIQTVMAMLHVGAKNTSKTQIEQTFYFNAENIHGLLGTYLDLLNKPESTYSLSTANKIFVNQKFQALQPFLDTLKTHYQSVPTACDFGGKPGEERKKINDWVSEQTKSKITDLLPDGLLNSLTAMVLVNAIYFKGSWENKFDAMDTKIGKFHLDDSKQIDVPMMQIQKKFQYGFNEELDCTILELPYSKKDLSMFFILPLQTNGLSKLEDQLTAETLNKLTAKMYSTTVNVRLPKFKLEAGINLKDILIKLGLIDIWDDNKADLSGIDGSKELFVSEAIHKAFISVDEEGTEAAAATAAVIMTRSLPIIEQFHADHPFLFFIHDNRAKMILFWGRFVQPDPDTPRHEEL